MANKNSSEQNFLNAIKRLENIVQELEKQDIDLEKALALYEEGIHLSRICSKKINEAERKIQILKNGDKLSDELTENGNISSEPVLELFNNNKQ